MLVFTICSFGYNLLAVLIYEVPIVEPLLLKPLLEMLLFSLALPVQKAAQHQLLSDRHTRVMEFDLQVTYEAYAALH